MQNSTKNVIPVFFSTDDNYAPFLTIALSSMLENASKNYFYKIIILSSKISEQNKQIVKRLETPNSSIEFISLTERVKGLQGKLHTRDYYSKETYNRFFIANLFPEFDKVLYLDADMVMLGDVSELYNMDMSDYLVAACEEEVILGSSILSTYVEKALGINRQDYFNAGMLVMNTARFRKEHIEEQFIKLLKKYTFTVAQDQDYLNILCKHAVLKLNLGWNKAAMKNESFSNDDLRIIHYKLNLKPWHYDNIEYEKYFWDYAKQSPYFAEIVEMKETYSDKQKVKDALDSNRMLETAFRDSKDPNNYWNSVKYTFRKMSVMHILLNWYNEYRRDAKRITRLLKTTIFRYWYGNRQIIG